MADYIFLMHGGDTASDWPPIAEPVARSVMRSGSAIGDGACVRKDSPAAENITDYIKGYIKDEAGGVIEVREPPIGAGN